MFSTEWLQTYLDGLAAGVIGAAVSVIVLLLANAYTRKEAERTRAAQGDAERLAHETNAVAELLSEIQTHLDLIPHDPQIRSRVSALATVLWVRVRPAVSAGWRSASQSAVHEHGSLEHPLHLALRAKAAEMAVAYALPATALRSRTVGADPFGTDDPPQVVLGLGDPTDFHRRLADLTADLLDWMDRTDEQKRVAFDDFLQATQQELQRTLWFANRLLGGTDEHSVLDRLDDKDPDSWTHTLQKGLLLARGLNVEGPVDGGEQVLNSTYLDETIATLPASAARDFHKVIVSAEEVRPRLWAMQYELPSRHEDDEYRLPVRIRDHRGALETYLSRFGDSRTE